MKSTPNAFYDGSLIQMAERCTSNTVECLSSVDRPRYALWYVEYISLLVGRSVLTLRNDAQRGAGAVPFRLV